MKSIAFSLECVFYQMLCQQLYEQDSSFVRLMSAVSGKGTSDSPVLCCRDLMSISEYLPPDNQMRDAEVGVA